MKQEKIFCDVCADEFARNAYWDNRPSDVTLVMGGPGANDGKVALSHVCWTCRKGIREAVDAYLISRAPQPIPPPSAP